MICSSPSQAKRAALKSLIAILIVLPLAAQAQDAAQQYRIAKVNFNGLVLLTQDQALTVSGLKIGDTITVDALDVAGQKLVDSGLFGKISYRIRSVKNDATIDFDVEELKATIPVVYDNFVWFTDDELLNAIKTEIPTYNGTAPASGNETEAIRKALARVLVGAKIGGDVQYTLSATESGRNDKHVFTVTGVKIPVCSIHFKGARAVNEADLVALSNVLFKNDYSREIAGSFTLRGILPTYFKLGRLKAQVNFESAKVEETDTCKGGAAVTYIVDEGDIYTWAGVDWKGNTDISSDDLTASMGMKPGEVANAEKIGIGLGRAETLFGKKGYVTLRMKATQEFDDSARKVVYHVGLSQGPRYTMGTLTFKHISDAEAEKLQREWKLEPGQVFDSTYPLQFLKQVNRNASVITTLNKDNLTVNVVIQFG